MEITYCGAIMIADLTPTSTGVPTSFNALGRILQEFGDLKKLARQEISLFKLM